MQAKMLVERLASLGAFDVHYLARRTVAAFEAQGYTVHKIPAGRAIAGTFLLDAPGLLKMLRRLQPDVIYQRVGCTYTGVAAWFARRHGKRMIWHVSSDRDLVPAAQAAWRSPIVGLNKALMTYGARHAATVVVQNQEQTKLLARWHARHDAVLIPNFHPDAPLSAPKPEGRITVCWVGNVKMLKGPELFLRLASDFRDLPRVEFVIAGGKQMQGRAWESFLAQTQSLPNLRYLGQLPQTAVDDLLVGAHILVNTSPVEGFPNTFIQAWLREVAVVSLMVNPDGVFDDERFGMCANGSYERMSAALRRLVADASLRARIGAAGRELARERFSERNIDQLIGLCR